MSGKPIIIDDPEIVKAALRLGIREAIKEFEKEHRIHVLDGEILGIKDGKIQVKMVYEVPK